MTTTPVNVTADTDNEEHRTQTEEPTPNPTTNDPNGAPTKFSLMIQREDNNRGIRTPTEHGEEGNVETHKTVEQNSEALTDDTSSPDQDIRTKPNI